jgi:hypothetical protein
MGRVAVRSAITSTIQDAAIEYVGSVFPARPVIIEEEQYLITMSGYAVAASEGGSSCVMVVNMPEDARKPFALVGRPNVMDFDKHQIVIELYFANTAGEGITAQQDYDAIVDALVILIRANPTMSAPASVWSAGEYSSGVTHTHEAPYSDEDGQTVFINGVVRFEAWEQLAGSGV